MLIVSSSKSVPPARLNKKEPYVVNHRDTVMVDTLKEIAVKIRKSIIRMHRIGPNVGSALSCVDVLTALYFDAMHIDSVDDPDRDRFILSKGHAVSALYAALAGKGFLDEGLLDQYMRDGGTLFGHPVRGAVPGVEVSTGSLGHGLPIALGMALAAKNDGKTYRVFVLMGDGECQEGSVWEGAIAAARLQLDNITVIIDANNLQGYERVENIMSLSSLSKIWRAFGWGVVETDGHDIDALKEVFSGLPLVQGSPSVVVARTVKGKGISEMEDALGWHYFSVPEDKVDDYQDELERGK